MTSSVSSPLPSDHPLHDRLLVVRAATEQLEPADRSAADALLAGCWACRELADDIHAFRAELAALPAPRRPRDFRLSAADAERLRGSPWRRVLALLGSPGFGFVQPLAGVVIAIGLMVVVVGSLPLGGLAGSRASGQGGSEAARAPVAAPGASASPGASAPGVAAFGGAQGSPAAGRVDQGGGASAAPGSTLGAIKGGSPAAGYEAQGKPPADSSTAGSGSRLAVESPPDSRPIGLTLAALGLALLVVSRYARRRVEDPLAR